MKVGGVSITKGEFESMIDDIEPKPRDAEEGGEDEKDRRQMGEDYASVMMLSQLAVAEHLDQTPDVRRQLMVNRLQILSDAQFNKLRDQSKPTAQEIEQYYSSHPDDFDRVLMRRLFIWKKGAGSNNANGLAPDAAKARADAILQAAKSGGDPQKLADEFKDSHIGLLDAEPITFNRGILPPKMEQIAFSLKKGEWAEGEDSPDRIILFHLVDHNRQPLTEAKSVVEQRVQNRKVQAKLDEMKKKAGIWMDEKYFGTAMGAVSGEQQPVSGSSSKVEKLAEERGEK